MSSGYRRTAVRKRLQDGQPRRVWPVALLFLVALPVGVWTHVAVTHTGNLGVLFVGGAEVARNSALTVRPSALGATSQNWIGRSQYAGDPYLAAAVDNFRVYNRALSAAEVSQLHANGQ